MVDLLAPWYDGPGTRLPVSEAQRDILLETWTRGDAGELRGSYVCSFCSLRKWAKQTATDPDSGEEVPLFNPRTQAWGEHFRWEGERVVPLTPTGRATVAALAMNRPLILAIRQEEAARGRHPPP